MGQTGNISEESAELFNKRIQVYQDAYRESLDSGQPGELAAYRAHKKLVEFNKSLEKKDAER